MRRADQIAGLALLVSAIWYAAVALEYHYGGAGGPGSGFMPFWLGVALGVLALLLLARASRAGALPPVGFPAGSGLRRLLVVLALSALFVLTLDAVGMILGTALFLVAVLGVVERYPWWLALGIAAGIAALNYLVFTRWLRVPFPSGFLGF